MEWILSNLGTIFVGLVLLAVIGLALHSVRKDMQSGGCSGCTGCSGSCSCCHSKGQNKKTNVPFA